MTANTHLPPTHALRIHLITWHRTGSWRFTARCGKRLPLRAGTEHLADVTCKSCLRAFIPRRSSPDA